MLLEDADIRLNDPHAGFDGLTRPPNISASHAGLDQWVGNAKWLN